MSQNSTAAVATMPSETLENRLGFDYAALIRTDKFKVSVLIALLFGLVFWNLLRGLPDLWFKNDSAYSHGILVPFLAGYILVQRWQKFQQATFRPSFWGLLLLVPILYVAFVANRTGNEVMASRAFILALGFSVWFLCGFKVAWLAAPSILYLLFGLPVWTQVIDKFTQPMQVISTNMSETMLKVLGYELYKVDSTTLLLSNFEMNVGAPCSGLKLMISLLALMVFFVLIAGLKWWANLFIALFIFPLAILTNGIRIAMIGVVGNSFGPDAGHQFHDYSGYISLVICFVVLQKVCRALGWK